jgi:hypothetical protein
MTITLNRRTIFTVVALVLVTVVAYVLGTSRTSGTAFATNTARTFATSSSGDPDHISVSAVGTVTGTPDTLRTSFSVSVVASSVKGAVDKANGDMAAVQKALKADGVADKDMQTSNVSLSSYSSRATKGGPLTRHYQMSESLIVTLRSIDNSSKAIQDGIAAGGSAVNLDYVSLDLTDDSALLTAARKNAFDSAKAKATQYAGLAGRPLGTVSSISETVNNPNTPIYYGDAYPAARGAAPMIPIQKGSQDVTVTVTVVFALG